MTSTEAITNILNEQVSGYRMLLDLLQKERACLLDLNTEGVEGLAKEKDTLVLRLRLLEEERIRLMKKFSEENPQSGLSEDMSLRKLGEVTGDSAFQDIRSKLVSLLQSIEELNESNRVLIERSLNYVRSTANFFGSFGLGDNSGGKGTLLSTET
jgi:flagellar biosynthesis/type III secretory pathway chaperone